MKLEDVVAKQNNLEMRFDALRDTMNLFQQNINNNITWFYAVLGIMAATIGVALYFLVKNAVNSGIEKGILKAEGTAMRELNSIKDELDYHKAQFNENVIKLIKENQYIKWASGTLFSPNSNLVSITGIVGPIDWESNITMLQVKDVVNRKTIQYKFVQKFDNGFTIELENIDFKKGNLFEWTLVWVNKR